MSFNELNLTSSFSESALSIICVRNPIHRIISHYYYFDYNTYNRPLYTFNYDEIKNYMNSRKTMLNRLSGNTFNLYVSKNNLNKINCILIMENFSDEIKLFENYLNNKFKTTHALNNVKFNETNYNNINYDKEKDTYFILKHSHIISDELELYYHILNMPIKDRYK